MKGSIRTLAAFRLALTVTATLAAGGVDPTFAPAINLGMVDVGSLRQASGVSVSTANAGVLWTHNDAGDAGRIYALDATGQALGTYNLPFANIDYEDMAFGPGPVSGVSYMFVGDIGDNNASRASIIIYRIPEPAVYLRQAVNPRTLPLKGVASISLSYPDGAHNAEAMFVDPLTGDLFIATKEAGRSMIFTAGNALLNASVPGVLTLVGEVAFDLASGAAISPTGGEIVLRQEDFARLWTRAPGQSVGAALAGVPVSIPVVGRPTEDNGEAIGFDPSGRGYYTLSDSSNTQPLYYFSRTSAYPFAPPRPLIFEGSSWRYLDSGTDQGTAWRLPAFNDAAWKIGDGPFGYGDGDEQTVVSFGGNGGNRYPATYFRKTFTVAGAASIGGLALRMQFDDGAAVYLNGSPIVRANLSTAALFNTLASGLQEDLEDTWFTYVIDPALLVDGPNTIAVEVHQQALNSPDLSFDLSLTAYDSVPASCAITRLPDGAVRLHITGTPFSRSAVEVSPNLTTWSALTTATLGAGTVLFYDGSASGLTQRFYRLRRP